MENLRSPIVTLQNAIAGAAYRIAPEREPELSSYIEDQGAAIAIDDGPGFRFGVTTSTKEITTNIATLEFLWASVHAHLILYDEYAKTQRSDSKVFDSRCIPRSRHALELLNWAVTNMGDSGMENWPSHLPRPEQYPAAGTDIHVANELFLCCIAWVVHHELAHLRLGHKPIHTTRSMDEEKDADLVATKWILDRCSDEREYRKRTYGIAAAILALQGMRDDAPFDILRSHPRAFERLDYCLEAAEVGEDEEVYAFAACIMQIQLSYCGVNIAHDGSSFKELYSNYLVEFAQK